MQDARENTRRLPGHAFPDALRVTGDLADLTADLALLALPYAKPRPLPEPCDPLRRDARLLRQGHRPRHRSWPHPR